MDYIKALKKKSEITEDEQKKAEKDLQEITDKYIKKVDEAAYELTAAAATGNFKGKQIDVWDLKKGVAIVPPERSMGAKSPLLADISRHKETVFLTAQAFNEVSSTYLREAAKLVSYDKFSMAFGWSDATSYKVVPPENLKIYNEILSQVYEAYNGKN